MFGLGTWELAMILVVALIFIGPQKLPSLARTLGKGMRDVRRAMAGFEEEVRAATTLPPDEPAAKSGQDNASASSQDKASAGSQDKASASSQDKASASSRAAASDGAPPDLPPAPPGTIPAAPPAGGAIEVANADPAASTQVTGEAPPEGPATVGSGAHPAAEAASAASSGRPRTPRGPDRAPRGHVSTSEPAPPETAATAIGPDDIGPDDIGNALAPAGGREEPTGA